MKVKFNKGYSEIISLENLLAAWTEFLSGKRKKKEAWEFGRNLTDNILQLHQDLANFTYTHGGYKAFNIADPKPRNIHKATVCDRVLHHAIYRQLYPFFDKTFIADSFSCRNGKGVHRALDRFRSFGFQVGKNNTRTVWVLKCDIKKFFASVDHAVLLDMLSEHIPDFYLMTLLENIIESFVVATGAGLPLGNLTSQLFCNIYMNQFDQFVKHKLKAKYYIRYADDFVFMSNNKNELINLIPQIASFLNEKLKLRLHPDKLFLKTLFSGVDFLGWTHFPYHRVLRTVTKRRMMKKIYKNRKRDTVESYLGLISYGNTFGRRQEILNWYGLQSGSKLE